MTVNQILADIQKGKFAPVYLLMGEETYFLDRIADALEHSVVPEAERDFNQYVYYGAEADLDVVESSCRQYPMMADRQFVILKEAQALERAKTALEKLASYVAKPNPSTVFCLVFKGDDLGAKSELMKAAAKMKEVVVFKSPRITDWNLAGYIKDHCSAKRINIEDRAVQMLAENVGSDLPRLFSEIDKLMLGLKPGSSRITTAMVEDGIGISKQFKSYELTSALGKRDYYKVQLIIHQLGANPNQNPTMPLVATMFNWFTKLAVANLSADRSDAAISKICEAKSERALRDFKMAMSNYPGIIPIKAIHVLRELDAQSKGNGSMQQQYPLLIQAIYKIFTIS